MDKIATRKMSPITFFPVRYLLFSFKFYDVAESCVPRGLAITFAKATSQIKYTHVAHNFDWRHSKNGGQDVKIVFPPSLEPSFKFAISLSPFIRSAVSF